MYRPRHFCFNYMYKVYFLLSHYFSSFPTIVSNLVLHSRPQRPCSFWSAPRIATSRLVQYWRSAIHGLTVKSDKSEHAQKIRPSQRSQFLVPTERSVASRDENEYMTGKKKQKNGVFILCCPEIQ